MANKPLEREQLAKNGIAIPQNTYFIAGQHNTTTDEVDLFDLEDLPPTHRKDLLQVVRDLERASARNNQERSARFPEIIKPTGRRKPDGKFAAGAAIGVKSGRSGDCPGTRP